MNKQQIITRSALMSVLIAAAVALAACANLPPIRSDVPRVVGTPAASETTVPPRGEATSAPVQPPTVTPPSVDAALIDAVRQALAQEVGVALSDIRVVSVGQVDWPNGCLGIETPGIMCTDAIVPGYQVILEANGKQYEYRSDLSGRQVVHAPEGTGDTVTPEATLRAPAAGETSGGPIIALRSNADGCFEARIDLNGVMFGACGEEMASGEFPADAHRLEQLADMYRTYSSFVASTSTGKVTFVGKGPIEPTPVEQRMIAEWAILVAQEAKAGPDVVQYGLTWHREGGIAGFCDDLIVETGGHAVLRSCKDTPETAAGWRRLTSEELTTYYGWIDRLGQTEFEQKDAAVADAMTIRGLLAGRGTDTGSESDKTDVLQFVSDLFEQWAEATPVQLIDILADLKIRQGPGEQFDVIETIAAGQQARVTGVNRGGTWWRVICPDDTIGHCWVSADDTLTRPIAPAGSTGEAPIDETGILGAVIRQVYTVDDTFGGQGNFATVYLLAVDDTEMGAIPYASKARPLPAPVQQSILAALTDLPSQFKWIASAGEAPRGENSVVQGNGAIVTIGKVRPQPDGTVHVAASIYAGMLAAGGQTYVLERQDGAWMITGTTGAAWIS